MVLKILCPLEETQSCMVMLALSVSVGNKAKTNVLVFKDVYTKYFDIATCILAAANLLDCEFGEENSPIFGPVLLM